MHHIFLITLLSKFLHHILFIPSCQCDLHLGCLDFVLMDMQVCSRIAAVEEYFIAILGQPLFHIGLVNILTMAWSIPLVAHPCCKSHLWMPLRTLVQVDDVITFQLLVVMWGQQYSRRPRTRGTARAAPKGAHGLEEPKEA